MYAPKKIFNNNIDYKLNILIIIIINLSYIYIKKENKNYKLSTNHRVVFFNASPIR